MYFNVSWQTTGCFVSGDKFIISPGAIPVDRVTASVKVQGALYLSNSETVTQFMFSEAEKYTYIFTYYVCM